MNFTLFRNTYFTSKIKYAIPQNISVIKRGQSRYPDAVFLENCIESPIIVVPKSNKVDIIGPPNSKSNLRPILRQQLSNETKLQQKLRQFQDDTQRWNKEFWSKHNTNFISERDSYIKSNLQPKDGKKTLSPDEMSEFYKKFLDENWESHVRYNFEWYKRNFLILYFALCVNLENALKFR